jgi:hypothetical protein
MRGSVRQRIGGVECLTTMSRRLVKPASRRSILNTQRGHPHSNPATYPACRDTRQHDGWGHKDRTCRSFRDFWLQFPAALPGQHLLAEIVSLPYQHVNTAYGMEVSRKGASEPSRSAARVRGRDCQMVFPSPIPIGYPAHVENNSNGVWFGDTFCSGPHRH